MQLAQNTIKFSSEQHFEPFEEKVGIQTVHFNEDNKIESSETKPIEVYLGAFSKTCEEFLRSKRFHIIRFHCQKQKKFEQTNA